MKKALLTNTFLMAAAVFYAGNTYAQNNDQAQQSSKSEILFKIHDIKPNKDDKGFVKDCGYALTVYNRTNSDIDKAALDVSWPDNEGNQVIEQDIVKDKDGKSKFDGRMGVKNKVISAFIDIPRTSAFEQVTLNLTAKTEKCYLLMGDVKFRVTSCKMIDKDASVKKSRIKQETCASMFKFISPTNPEYYKEFQPVSHEDQVSQAEKLKAQQMEKLEQLNNQIIKNYDETKKVLSEIK